MICTFYSFKGGVGRSMALANIGEWMYLQGARVLMMDWDLEAPGLENYFVSSETSTADLRSRLGLMDLLERYKQYFREQISGTLSAARQGVDRDQACDAACKRLDSLEDYIHPLLGSGESGAALLLMTAGSRTAARAPKQSPVEVEKQRGRALSADEYLEMLQPAIEAADGGARTFAEYAQNVQDFDWDDFLESYRGERFFEWLKRRLAPSFDSAGNQVSPGLADIVLIDSRTGITEMGGVCTRLLADLVVSFCAPNQQNLEGTVQMAESFRRPEILARRDAKPEVMLIPSRVEDRAESDDQAAFQALFERREREFATRIFRFETGEGKPAGATYWTLKIPYFPKLSYREALTFPVPEGGLRVVPLPDMQQVYQKLAACIVLHAPESSSVRARLAPALRRNVPELLEIFALLYLPDIAGPAAELKSWLESNGIQFYPDLDHRTGSPAEHQTALGIIAQAKAAVVVLSPAAAESAVLRNEIRSARRQGKAVFLVNGETDRQRLLQDMRGPCIAPRAPNMAPAVPDTFVERLETQERLRQALLECAPKPALNRIALTGAVGIGKTWLAVCACQDEAVQDAYPDGILWVSMAAPDFTAELRRVFSALTGGATQPPYQDTLRADLTQRLANRRFLLVLDDVRGPSDLDRLPSIPAPCTQLIVTSDPRAAAAASMVVRIGPLDPAQALNVLIGGLSPVPEGWDWARLAQMLSYSPKLLALANRALRENPSVSPLDAVLRVEDELERNGVRFERVQIEALDWQVQTIEDRLARAWYPRSENARLVVAEDPDDMAALKPVLEQARRDGKQIFTMRWGRPWNPEWDKLLAWLAEASGARDLRPRRQFASGGDRLTNQDFQAVEAALRAGMVTGTPDEIKARVGRLKAARYFGLAREYCALARQDHTLAADPRLKAWLPQQHALCTYKDVDLPVDSRLERALRILDAADPLERSTDPETLGIAGAIQKAMWARNGQRRHLEQSLAYYLRGHQSGLLSDFGYTGINAAYVLDLLACEEAGDAACSGQRREQARQIRTDLAARLPELLNNNENRWLRGQWWFLMTIAEANFGLGTAPGGSVAARRYEEARYWIRQALARDFSDWEYQSTARQMVDLARLHKMDRGADSEAMHTLHLLLGNDTAVIENLHRGKVGLALSGGGFRASFFHLGVLARLAETDMLRHIEVLSCVSGGSIVGAQYYLEVRRHLNKHPELSRDDAVAIVRKLQRDFLAGVQQDVRNRLLASWTTSLGMALVPGYSQTAHLGELYEKLLYSRVDDGEGKGPRWLNDLLIHPPDAAEDFSPKVDNWRRHTKVPILVLNATTLNTGHNWQFTASWMGESPGYINSEIDANERLRRMYFYEAPKPYRRFRLGDAVAASSAVPVLFDPLELPGLYPGRTIRLSDGGVHDNQGVAGLLEQECTVLLVSDASSQLNTEASPGSDRASVLMRMNSALMERVRWAEYDEISARRDGGVLRGLMFVHLKKDLETQPVAWTGNTDPPEPPDDPGATVVKESDASKTGYGVLKKRQRLLAAIRTDLDAFTEEEAYGLMLSGYRMVAKEFPSCVSGFPVSGQTEDWEFRKVAPLLDDPGREPRVLPVAGCRGGKLWKLLPWHRLAAVFTVLLAIAVLLRLYWLMVAPSAVVVAEAVCMGVGALALLLGGVALVVRKPLSRFVFGLVLGTVGWFVARLHLWLVRPCYLEQGRVGTPPRRGPMFRLNATVGVALLLLVAAVAAVVFNGNRIAQAWATRSARYSQGHGDYRQAVEQWSRVLKLEPANALAHQERAISYMGLQQPAPARDDLDAAIRAGLRPFATRALARISLGDYAGAVADYQEALRDAPNDAKLWEQLGYARRLAGNLFGSRAAYSQALRLAPDDRARAAVTWLDNAMPAQQEPPPAITLYIQVSNQATKARLGGLVKRLASADVIVPDIEVIKDPRNTPNRTELRYFRPEDRADADRLAASLTKLGVPAEVKLVRGERQAKARQLELWMGPDLALLY